MYNTAEFLHSCVNAVTRSVEAQEGSLANAERKPGLRRREAWLAQKKMLACAGGKPALRKRKGWLAQEESWLA